MSLGCKQFFHKYNMPIKLKKLQGKWYYRFAKVIFWLVVLISFSVPFFKELFTPSFDADYIPNGIFNGLLIAVPNAVVLYIFWKILVYVIWGGVDKGEK